MGNKARNEEKKGEMKLASSMAFIERTWAGCWLQASSTTPAYCLAVQFLESRTGWVIRVYILF